MAEDLRINAVHNFLAKSHGVVVNDLEVDGILMDFFIPDYILVSGSEKSETSEFPSCPVMVFINTKSGGQLGGELLVTYRSLLNKNQVVDLGEKAPEKVLHQLYVNLEKHKQSGDRLSSEIQKSLRLIVAGGDGTAGWLLGVVSDLKLAQPPPVATVPLGTGNNIPFSFGWGKKNPGIDRQSVKSFLDQVRNARERKIDSWHILMRMRAPKEGSCDPIAPLELPRSLHAFHRVSKTDSFNKEGYHTFRGGFWNYFSMGMDAQVSYAFHTERKLNPEKFKNQFHNQSTYAKLGCSQGWFCASSSRNTAQLAKVKIMKRSGQWEDLHIPPSIRSIICLNLPSFSGGFNPWGTPNPKKLRMRDLTLPYVDDGFLEIVGFRNAWHGLVLLAPTGHGTRLAQANRIRFEFHKGAADHTFMRIDGEPWKQPLPEDDDTVTIEISHFGQMEESTKRRERLKAMREEASEAAIRNNNNDGEDSSNYHRLFNPLIETPGSDSVQTDPRASPRFDFYTHPMSAFSGNKNSSSSKVSPQTPKDHFTPPSLPSPQLQPQMNYPSNQQTYQTQGPTFFPSNSPRGLNLPNPNFNPGQGRGPWFSNNPNPSGGPSGSPGFQHGGSSPNLNPGQGRGQWFSNNPGPDGNPNFNPGQGRGHWLNNNPGPGGGPGFGQGRGHYPGGSPGFGQGSRPSFNPGQGRGNRFISPGNAGPSSGRGHWVNPGQGRGGGRGRAGHNNLSAEQRPDLYYNKSMIEDPWELLEPIVWRRENIPSLNVQRKSWIPESIRGKKVKVVESSTDSGSKQSLAEYLAASFNEAVKEEQPRE